jgi:ketosteroid isomerase-like protein
LFFSGAEPGCFDIQQLSILAGSDVAFAVALMKCSWKNGDHFEELDFRLTTGLVKARDGWMIAHEHHSVPAAS